MSELRYQTVLLLCLALATALLIFLPTSPALRPIAALQSGFNRLEQG